VAVRKDPDIVFQFNDTRLGGSLEQFGVNLTLAQMAIPYARFIYFAFGTPMAVWKGGNSAQSGSDLRLKHAF
jgi:hypothetical protein